MAAPTPTVPPAIVQTTVYFETPHGFIATAPLPGLADGSFLAIHAGGVISAISATGVSLKDLVPANTTYVANSTLLNGAPVGQPDSGVAPLASGISIGTIAAGTTAA